MKKHKTFFELLKFSAIPITVFTIWFILDPSLNLSKMVLTFKDQVPVEELRSEAFYFASLGYVICIITIFLFCTMKKKCGMFVVWYNLLCTAFIFFLIPLLVPFLNFPWISQITMVWSRNPLWPSAVILRYKMLLTWLVAWDASFALTIWIITRRKKA